MVALGYALSSEEHRPDVLVTQAQAAEQHGFSFALISDHYHPWTEQQGQSAFVWGVLGAIGQATSRLQIGTGVTCPIIRLHPAIVAQAAATAAVLLQERFFLGVGSGEWLNEHIVGGEWPTIAVRQEMLDEAIDVMRMLWRGRIVSHHGAHYVVDEARVYSLPRNPVPIFVAAKGNDAAETAGRNGDGLIGLAPDRSLLGAFDEAGGRGKPRIGQVAVCWAASDGEARRTVHECWPNIALRGRLSTELKTPTDVEAAVEPAGEDTGEIIIGPDPARHLEAIRRMVEAGYDHIYVHQIGPQQAEMMRFYERQIMPALELQAPRLAQAAQLTSTR